MAVTGWYPDPAGAPQLRFWDGQSWTTATAPPPQPQAYAPQQPSYAPHPQPGPAQPAYATQRPPERGRRFWTVVAGVVVAGAVVVAAVPLVTGGKHHPPTTAAFEGALLTAGEVSATANGTFTIDPPDSNDDSGNSDTNSDTNSDDCSGTDLSKVIGPDAVKADAEADFSADAEGMAVSEDLSYIPGKAASVMNTLEPEAQACHTMTLDGTRLDVSMLPAPPVATSSDTFAFQASGKVNGRVLAWDFEMARFGDSIVTINYLGFGDPSESSITAAVLLTQASAKAEHVF